MSPTVFRYKGFRFFFFSREENRLHVHVYCAEGEAKFWLEPVVELAHNYNVPDNKIKELFLIIEKRKNEIKDAWDKHFGS
jgi:hypothetical protein